MPNNQQSILVKPQKSLVSEFCTKLTGIRQELLENAGDFSSVCNILKEEYLSIQRAWASWGNYDRVQFERDCSSKAIQYPFGKTHLNVKNLFAMQLNLDREVDLDAAYKIIGATMPGEHHRGGDDAFNIARILCWITKRARHAANFEI